MGKNSNSIKLLAQSEEERNIWVLAIQLMILYHLKMDFMQEQFQTEMDGMVAKSNQ